MEGWWGTQRCNFLLGRVMKAANAPHVAQAKQTWVAQVELLVQQAQALQQLGHTQKSLMAECAEQQAAADGKAHDGPAPSPAQPERPEDQPGQEHALPEPIIKAAMPVGGGEELLRAVFSVVDTPSPEEIRALALQVGRSQGHVRSFFTKLRSSMQVN